MKLVRKGQGGLESYWNTFKQGIKDFGAGIVEGASYDPEGSLARAMAGLKPIAGESPVTITSEDLKKKLQVAHDNWLLGYAPFAAAAAPIFAPGTAGGYLVGNLAGAALGGTLVDEASRATTGNTWGLNVYNTAASLMPKDWHAPQLLQLIGHTAADFTNPGYVMGGPLAKYITNAATKAVNSGKLLLVGPDGNIFNSNLVYNRNNWYRSVDKFAIDDAINTGVIRGNKRYTDFGKTYHPGAFFGKGRPLEAYPAYVIEGTPSSALWVDPYSKTFLLVGETDASFLDKFSLPPSKIYPYGRINLSMYTKENGFFQPGLTWEAFPAFNGKINTAPASNFTYYKQYPIIGWRLKLFTNKLPFIQFGYKNTSTSLSPRTRKLFSGLELSPLKTLAETHLQGNDAVKMFKEYGGEPWPEGNANGKVLMKYVPEAREKYGLVGNTDITDEEIALALYKHAKQNGLLENGEPLISFRGDTDKYTLLKPKKSPEEYWKYRDSTDNALGMETLQGDFTNTGVDRYLYTYAPQLDSPGAYQLSTPYHYLAEDPYAPGILDPGGIIVGHHGNWGRVFPAYKVPASETPNKVNEVNSFIFKPGTKIYDMDAAFYRDGSYGEEFIPHVHRYLNEALLLGAGLLRAIDKGDGMLEHNGNYIIVPNHNMTGAKHLLPYDLRVPRNWNNPNIYKTLAPFLLGAGALSSKEEESKK